MKLKPYAIQLVLKNGVHVTVGVASYNKYLSMKKKITCGSEKYVNLADTCTVCAEDVSLIEFVTLKEGE